MFASRRRLRAWPVALAVGALLASACGGTAAPIASPSASDTVVTTGSPFSPEQQQLLDEAVAASTEAGCGEVQVTQPYAPEELDRAHIGGADVPTPPPLSSCPSTPPASGPHDPVPLPAGVYSATPPVQRTIHSMEHAAVVVWFSPGAAADPAQAEELARLAAFLGRPDEADHVIVAPYDVPGQGAAGVLPAQTSMALVAWHRLRLCRQVSLPVAFAFIADFRFDPEAPDRYRGEAPELGVPIG